jgi:hypothetical protein
VASRSQSRSHEQRAFRIEAPLFRELQELPLLEPWAQAKVLELLESIDLFNAAAQRFNDLHMQASESPRVTYSYEHWRLLTHAEKIVETVNELQPVLLGIAGSRTHMVSRIEVAEGE